MKYILIVAVMFICASAFAQGKYIKEDVEKMTSLYKLDETQASFLENLLIQKEKKLLEVINSGFPKKVVAAKRVDIIAENDKKFREILNAEQLVLHEKIVLADKQAKKDSENKKLGLDPKNIKGAPKDGKTPSSK